MGGEVLIGQFVRLRAVEPGDVDVLYTWENDSSVWQVSNTLTPFSRFQVEEYVLNSQQDIFASRQLRLMIVPVESAMQEQPVGTIDLFDFDPVHRRAGVGILIRGPYREKGYAQDAMEILIRYSFGTLRLHQLYCNISPDNTPSLHLFGKLGFEQCGVKKEWFSDGLSWKDEWMFQLISHGR
ncbi:MAG: GNAT family N-acetyltransferase [Bacteroidales bacterium]